ncbi:HAD-IIIA family hydrolase [soil metagenome]
MVPLPQMNVLNKLSKVRNFVFDMDGVLTDGNLFIHENMNWVRQMNIKDGYALQLAVKCGYKMIVVSGSHSPPVAERLRKLGIEDVFMGVVDKRKLLADLITNYNIDSNELLYMGDDLPDYEAMNMAGVACCPADAATDIKKISSYISYKKGGEGCVRDVIEKVLRLNNHWPLQTTISSI